MIPERLYQAAIARFRRAGSVVLTTHVNPDADGLGALAALRRWLLGLGARVEVVVPSPPARKYAFLDPDGAVRVAGRDVDPAAARGADVVCVLDTCTRQQLEAVEPLLSDPGADVLVIDHHRTHDPLGRIELLDPDAAATAVLVHRLLVLAGARIDPATAADLFVGLVGDTDWFRLPNVNPETLRLAADLTAAGARPWDIHSRLNLSDPIAKLHLWGEAVLTLHSALGGRAAVLHVTQEMLRTAGAEAGDTESLVNVCLQVRGARVGVMLVEAEPGEVRISLRSAPGVDVLQVAERFGGGGHVRAAGARGQGTLEAVEAEVLEAVEAALADAATPPGDAENA